MNNPQTQNTKQRPTPTPQKWHWRHAPKTSRLQQPDHTTDRNPWTPTQLPAHIRTITIHLTRKIHKWSECASKGRQQKKKMEKTKSLTQINFGPISQWNNLLKWQQKVRAGSQGQTQISKYWPINDQILNLIPVFQSFHSKEKGQFWQHISTNTRWGEHKKATGMNEWWQPHCDSTIPLGGSIRRQKA
jgi:hypothetical protein